MKTFLYCENEEGGMSTFTFSSVKDLSKMRGWMKGHCRHSDKELKEWIETAEVGDFLCHRLGVAVRLKDGTNTEALNAWS